MIPLYKSFSDESDIKAVTDVIKGGMDWAEGPHGELFEERLCKYLSIQGALVCNSGTSALHMALFACGVKHFHEVIVPSFTFIATANAVRFIGATPVFADIEEESYGLDPVDVERKITDKTAAIIVVHYGGQICKGIMDIRAIAQKHNLKLIEDGCESLGALYDRMPVSRFGDCAVLSFCANKIISTGEGGAFCTDSKYLYDRARLMRSHGRDGDRYISLGYNFRMPDMNAALGVSQLEKIDDIIEKRREIAGWYKAGLNLPELPDSVFQLLTVRLKNRDQVMRHLQDNGIGCKVYFEPVHLTDYYRRDQWKTVKLPITERVSSEVLSLPIYPGLTKQEVEMVCQKVREIKLEGGR